MKASLRLGSPLGIPVGIHWSALLVGLLATWSLAGLLTTLPPDYPGATYWVAAVVTVALHFAGLVAHELAHAVLARRHGIGTRGVTLWALGGLAELERWVRYRRDGRAAWPAPQPLPLNHGS
jgi:Zn-dependent protease